MTGEKTILFISTGIGRGGIATALIELLDALETRGYKVEVLAQYDTMAKTTAIPNKFMVGYIWKRRIKSRIIIRLMNLFHIITQWRFYFLGIRRRKHDILMVYQGAPYLARYSRKPSFCWMHGVLATKGRALRDRVWDASYENEFRRYNKIFAVSEEVAASFKARYPNLDTPTPLPNILAIDKIKILSEQTITSMGIGLGKNIVCVARLSPEKGVLRLLSVVKKLVLEGRNFSLTIVGDGPHRNECFSYVETEGLGSVVKFVGMQGNPYPYMRLADLLVCPSYSEGLGMVLWEALICHTPVLATDCGGTRSALRGGEWGCLVANNEGAIFSALSAFIAGEIDCMPRTSFENVEKELREINEQSMQRLCALL